MTRFDDNLWREVERRYGSELSDADGPLSSAPRGRLPVIAGASLGVAGASAAAVIVLSAASSPPAFAVTTHRDGTVSLVIRRIDGIPGANRRLAQLGIHVRAVQVDARCQAAVAPALRHVTVAGLTRDRRAGWIGTVEGGVKARIRPQQIARNHTLVIAAVASRGQVRLVRGRAVRGAIPGCLPPVAWVRSAAAGSGRTDRVLWAPRRSGTRWSSTRGPTRRRRTRPRRRRPASGSATVTGPTTATAPPTSTNQTATTATTATTTATTGSGTSTNWQSQTSASPAGATPVAPPPIIQACLNAARHATQVQQVPQTAARAHH